MAIPIATMGLAAILIFAIRSLSMPADYGGIPVEIPVMPVFLEDPAHHTYRRGASYELQPSTATVVLTTRAIYYGDMNSFTSDYRSVRNKIVLHHIDGRPQLKGLLNTVKSWNRGRSPDAQQQHEVVVFVPSGDIPAPIVLQIVEALRGEGYFKRVVLGGGLI